MRLVWVLDARLPTPLVNVPVFDLRESLVAVADLLDPEAGVIGEYDGADHRTAHRHSSDLAREDRCRAVNLDFFRLTGPDMRDRQRLVSRMQRARSRGLRRDRSRDAWTLIKPNWYPVDLSLDERRELSRLYAANG